MLENTFTIKPVWNGAKLQEKRKLLGKSRYAMAKLLGMASSSYTEMEQSQIKPDSPNLTKLCMLFNCLPEDFFDLPKNFCRNNKVIP